jgi:predicted MPP superfamily phosphohydrolase
MANRIFALLFISLLLLLLDLYLYKAIKAIRPNWSAKQKRVFTYGWWGYSILITLGVFIGVYFNIRLTLRSILMVAFFLSSVAKLFFLPFVVMDDFRRSMLWMRKKYEGKKKTEIMPPVEVGEPISRSQFLVKAGLLAAAVPISSLSFGILTGAYDYQLRRQKLFLPNLPKAFDGLQIAQISDVHSGSFYNKKAVLGGVEMLLGEKPDAIFFTGDLVNNIASEMNEYQDIFSKLKAPLGVFSVLGNHDYGDYYYGREPSKAKAENLAQLKKTHQNMGWDLLLNENRRLKADGEEIAILGIENWGAGRFAKYGRLDQAVQGTEDAPVKLLLSHDPSHWRAQVLPDYPQIDAMFSGHTHGMQFGIRNEFIQWSPVQYIYKEWAGLYQEGHQQIYVNVGYGFLGYPGRLGMLPEITLFELKSGQPS